METEKSLAMEIITDYKKANKRMFIIILVILGMLFATIGFGVYYIINYTAEEETTTETATTDNGGNACVGDNCNNGEINNGNGKESN